MLAACTACWPSLGRPVHWLRHSCREFRSGIGLRLAGTTTEFGLGLILAGIALALVTIGNVLAFQFFRIQQLIRTGERS
ncbi:MAG: hypothetical protein IH943_12875 [Acidobacteria bacterium]|nr:hypothetical protein [Acidobacteriota bacterium]